tara:strand:+ start:2423 stop:3280 length:858 start_codon:yes stop_codon:yes gene_type:complete
MTEVKNIAILGSSGQIGAPLFDYLVGKGYNVHGYDSVPSNTTTHVTDLGSPHQFDNITLEKYDFVFFLAFNAGGSRYLKQYQDTHEFVESNSVLMTNVFSALNRSKTPFIFSSSQMSNMTFSTYGLLKLVGEMYTKLSNGVVIKFWNVYGVEHDQDKSHVITDFIEKARDLKRIDMLTDGREERQFLHTQDCCECLETLMLRYDEVDRDQPLHITSFEWTTIADVADIIAAQFPGCEVVPAEDKDTVQQGLRNDPDPYIRQFWQPITTLDEGIAKVISESRTSVA